ncbi:MAG: PilZ domain-containing protein [Spirochaetota bacterium]
MKILLVAEKENTKEILTIHLKPRGFEFIHYRNPIKAMDNVEEIDPDLVLFSAEDFPRHWKPFLNILREFRSKERTVFILLRGDLFPFDEAAKAVYLGVNGIISEDFSDRRKMIHLENLFCRYKNPADNRGSQRYIPDTADELEFIFTHPETMKLVTGLLSDISLTGASFKPDNPHLTADLKSGTELPFCSLKIGETIISINCRIVRNKQLVAIQFVEFSSESNELLKNYFENRPERELKLLKQGRSAS